LAKEVKKMKMTRRTRMKKKNRKSDALILGDFSRNENVDDSYDAQTR
jgi:hypothetical protein